MIYLLVPLVALVVFLLLFLWGHLENSYGWKGSAFGCASLIVLVMVALEIKYPTSGFSPLNLVDPSDGEPDPELEAALERALEDQPSELETLPPPAEGAPGNSPQFPEEDVVNAQVRDIPELEARLRGVPGWDMIVLVGPPRTGEEAVQDPRVTSWWLRRRITAQWDPRGDSYRCRMFVVRDGALVATMNFQSTARPAAGWTSVTVRNP